MYNIIDYTYKHDNGDLFTKGRETKLCIHRHVLFALELNKKTIAPRHMQAPPPPPPLVCTCVFPVHRCQQASELPTNLH